MSNLVTVKLKRDIDLIGSIKEDQKDYLILENPIQVKLDTNEGFYAVDWLYLSNTNSVTINKEDMIYFTECTDRANKIYNEFWEANTSSRDETSIDEMLSIFESKISTKH
jgi:hypothetical protein